MDFFFNVVQDFYDKLYPNIYDDMNDIYSDKSSEDSLNYKNENKRNINDCYNCNCCPKNIVKKYKKTDPEDEEYFPDEDDEDEDEDDEDEDDDNLDFLR